MRKSLFKLHKWIGVQLGFLLFIICFTGTLSSISNEIDWLLQPDYRASPQEKLVSRNIIAQNFANKYPNAKISYLDQGTTSVIYVTFCIKMKMASFHLSLPILIPAKFKVSLA